MTSRHRGQYPVAVFQADCLARGRRLFDRVMKEELVHRMQQPFARDGVLPAWFAHATRRGQAIQPGTVVTTGAWGGLHPVTGAAHGTLSIDGLGEFAF